MSTTKPSKSKTVHLERQGDYLIVTLGALGGRPFTLGQKNLQQLSDTISEIENEPGSEGLIFRGQESHIFCAGIDIEELTQGIEESQISALFTQGQEIFNRIEALPMPTIAAIFGSCVGGGLELALACDMRIATDHPKTRLGLPEVRLGILPAWGGTTRLIDIVGLKSALPLLLTGKILSARAAQGIGLIAETCPSNLIMSRAVERLKGLKSARDHGHHGNPSFRKVGVSDYVVQEVGVARKALFSRAETKIKEKTGQHYPAPLALIKMLRQSDGLNRKERFEVERLAAIELAKGPVATSLISIFRRNRDRNRGAPYDLRLTPKTSIKETAIVGAGVMGKGIALTLLLSHRSVVLLDPNPEALLNAKKFIDEELEKRISQRRLTKLNAQNARDRLLLTNSYKDLSSAKLIIEAVPENAKLKKEVLRSAVDHAQPNAIIASNTSSLCIADLASELGARKLYGLHFFNPAPKMPLVEIVRSAKADEHDLTRLVHFCRKISKIPVVVQDQPAFVVNRILTPYLLEALKLLSEGAPFLGIETAAKNFGFPMGPFELMDSIGLDMVKQTCEKLQAASEGVSTVPLLLDRLIERSELGKKTQRGFYRWRGSRKKAPSTKLLYKLAQVQPELKYWPEEKVMKRLTEELRSESRRVLASGTVSTEDDLDLASIFGMGFPPFTGGIASWNSATEASHRG